MEGEAVPEDAVGAGTVPEERIEPEMELGEPETEGTDVPLLLG